MHIVGYHKKIKKDLKFFATNQTFLFEILNVNLKYSYWILPSMKVDFVLFIVKASINFTLVDVIKCTASLSSSRSTHLGEGCHVIQYDMLRLSVQVSCKLTFNLSIANYLYICVGAFGLKDHFDVFRIAHSHNANVLCNLLSCSAKCLINMPP